MTNENLMAQFMEQMASSNPKMKMLSEMMKQQQTPNPVAKSKIAKHSDSKMKKLLHINKELKEQLSKSRKQNKHLMDYLDFFIDVNSLFSSSVGACECWGDDHECERCSGKGVPGTFEINNEAFSKYILPAIQQMKNKKDARKVVELQRHAI